MSKLQKIFSAISFGIVVGIIVIKIINNIKKHKIVRKWIYADGEEPICI